MCEGLCRDFASDVDHCGGCMKPCHTGEKCEAGICSVGDCAAGLTSCPASDDRTACENLAIGYPHCGACDVTCAATEVCAGGHCRSYVPAMPCTSCPCDDECAAALGPGTACCDALYGGVSVCVDGDVCP